MKTINQLIILMLTTSLSAWSQNDTTYFFGINGKTCDIENPEVKKDITYHSDKDITIETYNFNDGNWHLALTEKIKKADENEFKIHIEGHNFSGRVMREFEKLDNNEYNFTDRINKRIIRTGKTSSRIPLIFNGKVTEFYKNGVTKSVSVYKNNQLISNKNWLECGDPYIDNVFYSVDKEPVYKMGMPILHTNLRNAFLNSSFDISQVYGRIVVGFVVMEDGSIDGIRIEEGLDQKLNQVALDAFLNFQNGWQPAQLNGTAVRYYQIFPINFINKDKELEFIKMYERETHLGK